MDWRARLLRWVIGTILRKEKQWASLSSSTNWIIVIRNSCGRKGILLTIWYVFSLNITKPCQKETKFSSFFNVLRKGWHYQHRFVLVFFFFLISGFLHTYSIWKQVWIDFTYNLQNVFNLNSHYSETQWIFIKVKCFINLPMNEFPVAWLAGCLHMKGKPWASEIVEGCCF